MDKIKKPFYKKWWVWLIVVIIIVVITYLWNRTETPLSSLTKNNNTEAPNDSTKKNNKRTNTKTFKPGTYLVGTDIEAGHYRAKLSGRLVDIGYIERSSDVNWSVGSILANVLLTGNGYTEILPTDVAVRTTGVELTSIQLDELTPNMKDEVENGIFLVGIDVAPGTYKVEQTGERINIGYTERVSRVSMGSEDIIANQVFSGDGTLTIEEDDFAVRLQGVKITKQ